jgi:hypothetical protein
VRQAPNGAFVRWHFADPAVAATFAGEFGPLCGLRRADLRPDNSMQQAARQRAGYITPPEATLPRPAQHEDDADPGRLAIGL